MHHILPSGEEGLASGLGEGGRSRGGTRIFRDICPRISHGQGGRCSHTRWTCLGAPPRPSQGSPGVEVVGASRTAWLKGQHCSLRLVCPPRPGPSRRGWFGVPISGLHAVPRHPLLEQVPSVHRLWVQGGCSPSSVGKWLRREPGSMLPACCGPLFLRASPCSRDAPWGAGRGASP